MPSKIIASILLLICAIGLADSIAVQPREQPRTRREFAQAISTLKEGVPAAKVLAQLGKPDDIRTENDPGGISTVGTKEIWRYGTSGHLTFATLGQVYMDMRGRVQYVFGSGSPQTENLFVEQELRQLLDALSRVPSYNAGHRYNPRKVIQVVNLLQPLGKEKALAAIDEFLRVASRHHDDGREGVFLVLRTLFDVPDDPGYLPRMMVGAPFPSEPTDPKGLPRFPITIEGDIPFLLVHGYDLGGEPESPEGHVDYFRNHGVLRKKPLAPTNSPFDTLNAFQSSPRWPFRAKADIHDDEWSRRFLDTQLLRLVDSVYRVEPIQGGDLLPYGDDKADERNRIVAEAAKLTIRWNAERSRYTFLDGTALPEMKPTLYRREVWRPKVSGLDLELAIERLGSNDVSASLVQNYNEITPSPAAIFRLLDQSDNRNILGKLQIKAAPAFKGGMSTGLDFKLQEGKQVQLQLLVGEQSHLGPVIKP